MNNKHTIPMLRNAAKALGKVLMPQAAGMRLQTFDSPEGWGVALMTAKGDVECGYGKSERAALFDLTVSLGQRVGKL